MALHLQVTWSIKAQNPRWAELNTKLRACLDGYSWAKPLPTTYIVKIQSLEDRKAIHQRLIEICQGHAKEIYFLISPAMQGGAYGGWLPKDMWDKIRQRTEDDV
jgi:hypothetical protein